MNSATDNQTCKANSLWKLLKDYKVVIPIIQRDYAQGRSGKERLRAKFLKNMFMALEDGGQLTLDFIYGTTKEVKTSTEKKESCTAPSEQQEPKITFYPLDGQQRLTTLWLVHWYLAFKSLAKSDDETKEEARKVLRRFSYETRASSRDFCRELCGLIGDDLPQGEKVEAHIRSRAWFFADFAQDPTVKGMLNMLKDVEAVEEKFNEELKKSHPEGQFHEEQATAYWKATEYWNKLTGDKSPIVFYLMTVGKEKKLPLTDDLYIKMNARGKRLTDFENFKADLVKFKLEETCVGEINLHGGDGDVDASNCTFSHLVDTTWTNIFWQFRAKDNRIDEIWMLFFNRFFLCWYITHVRETGKDGLMVADALVKDPVFKEFTNSGNGEKALTYETLDPYNNEHMLNMDSLQTFYHILDMMSLMREFLGKDGSPLDKDGITDLFRPYWEGKETNADFCFIPSYSEKSVPTFFSWEKNVAFWGVCTFLKQIKSENIASKSQNDGKKSFKTRLADWMHFVWNMAENMGPGAENAIPLMRFLWRLKDKSQDIVTHLATLFHEGEGGVCASLEKSWDVLVEKMGGYGDQNAVRQLHEEVFKAWLVINGELNEEIIKEAESYAFFKGSIGFLFVDEEGCLSADDFRKKWDTARSVFENTGIADDKEDLSNFYSWCSNRQLEVQTFGCSHTKWKGTLSTDLWRGHIFIRLEAKNYLYAVPLHHFLLQEAPSPDDYTKIANGNPNDYFIASIFKRRDLMDFVLSYVKDQRAKIEVKHDSVEWVLHRRNSRESSDDYAYLEREYRDLILRKAEDDEMDFRIEESHKRVAEESTLLWHRDIGFTYRNQQFLWNRKNEVVLQGKTEVGTPSFEFGEPSWGELRDVLNEDLPHNGDWESRRKGLLEQCVKDFKKELDSIIEKLHEGTAAVQNSDAQETSGTAPINSAQEPPEG